MFPQPLLVTHLDELLHAHRLVAAAQTNDAVVEGHATRLAARAQTRALRFLEGMSERGHLQVLLATMAEAGPDKGIFP